MQGHFHYLILAFFFYFKDTFDAPRTSVMVVRRVSPDNLWLSFSCMFFLPSLLPFPLLEKHFEHCKKKKQKKSLVIYLLNQIRSFFYYYCNVFDLEFFIDFFLISSIDILFLYQI